MASPKAIGEDQWGGKKESENLEFSCVAREADVYDGRQWDAIDQVEMK